MFSRPRCRVRPIHAASDQLCAATSRWLYARLPHTHNTTRSLTGLSTSTAAYIRSPFANRPAALTHSTELSFASSLNTTRSRALSQFPGFVSTRPYSSLVRALPRLSSSSSPPPALLFPASSRRPCLLLLIPRRSQHQQQARGRDNTAIFQLLVVGIRFIARTLPFLWRNERVQAFYRRYPKSVLFLLVIPAGAVALLLASSASFVPYSNRLHFTFLGPASEQSLSLQAYQEVISSERERLLPPNDATVQQVKRVAGDILRVAVQDGVIDGSNMGDWQVNVIESNVANAFVLPSGQIFVYDTRNTHPHQQQHNSQFVMHPPLTC